MTGGSLGRRYARSLFDLASESSSVEETGGGLQELAAAVEGLEPGTLSRGHLSQGQRRLLAEAMAARAGAGSLLGRFLGVLAENDRLEQLPSIRAWYERMQDEAEGRVRIRVRTASVLRDEEREALRRRFSEITGRKIVDAVEIDDSLIGGLSVEVDGRVYDGSIRTQLARIERLMVG